MNRFNKVAMQIQNLSDKIAIEAMKNGTWLGRLKDDIMVQEPSTFTEAMTMATKLIKMDEYRRLRRDDDKTPPKIMIGPSLGDPDLNVLSSEVRQEVQLVDIGKRLRNIHLSML